VTSTKQNNVTDVLVIGSGMGGAAMSKRLSDAGIKVMCLEEQGDWVHPTQFPHFHDEWEFEKYRSWDFNADLRKGPEDYPVTGIVRAWPGSGRLFSGSCDDVYGQNSFPLRKKHSAAGIDSIPST